MKTMNGFMPTEIMSELDRQLPADAYKAITGGALKGLTDIKPAYVYKEMDRVFGPCGVGWGFSYDSEKLQYIKADKFAFAPEVHVWYNLYDGDNVVRSVDVPMPGYNTNNGSGENSIKGAITTGIGSAVHVLGFQISVYLGLRSHDKVYDQALAMYTDDTVELIATLRQYTDGPLAEDDELAKVTDAMKKVLSTEPNVSIRLMQLISGTRYTNVPKMLLYKMVELMDKDHDYHELVTDAFQEILQWW